MEAEERADAPALQRPKAPQEGPVVTVAGFWRRTLAGLVDLLVVAPIAAGVILVAARLAGLALPRVRRGGVDYWLDLFLGGDPALLGFVGLAAAVVVLYLFLFQVSAARTPGMALLRLRVIDVYGEPPGVVRVALRTVGTLLSVATLGLGFLWIGFDRERRGLHDWLAGTLVTRPPRAS